MENEYAIIEVEKSNLLPGTFFSLPQECFLWPFKDSYFVFEAGLVCKVRVLEVQVKASNNSKLTLKGAISQTGLGPVKWWCHTD